MKNHWFEYRWHKGMSRYYKVYLYKDLLGDWRITKAWGGIHSRLGNCAHESFNDYASAIKYIDDIEQVRIKHGYERIVSCFL